MKEIKRKDNGRIKNNNGHPQMREVISIKSSFYIKFRFGLYRK